MINEDKAAVVTKVSISKKYIGLGGAIGIVLAVLYIIIAYFAAWKQSTQVTTLNIYIIAEC